ncbi:MAG: pyridoxal-dependent decarboxylase [Nanoarchaeota archaeon]|nr:pyridoxal-dependent decarboxylase [Nanoarchaeota archaeon]
MMAQMNERNSQFKFPETTDGIPEEGISEEKVLEGIDLGGQDCLARYDKILTMAKPGTSVDKICIAAEKIMQEKYNTNAIDGEMFRGTRIKELEVIAMTAQLFGKGGNNLKQLGSGFLLSGGTESINQALWMYRNKFFHHYGQNGENDVRKIGVGKALQNMALARFAQTQKLDDMLKLHNPRILVPVNIHFSEKKAADLMGLGVDSIVYYDLDNNFDADLRSVERVVQSVYNAGDDIIMHYACGGDVNRGKVHDIRKINQVIRSCAVERNNEMRFSENQLWVPPTVVDSAGAYMFIGLMKDSEQYNGGMPEVSFNIPDVEAIIGDPHKQPMPYSCGMLMLKTWKDVVHSDLRAICNTNYLDMTDAKVQDSSSIFATIPTSRSGSNPMAIWAYYMYYGLKGMRAKKEKIWSLVQDFKEYINDSKYYELVCEPETQVVGFYFKGPGLNERVPKGVSTGRNGQNNVNIYRDIKHSSEHFHHISQDESMLIRTLEQQNEVDSSNNGDKLKYAGLFVTVMEHNTKEGVDDLKKVLEQEGKKHYEIAKREIPNLVKW